MTIYKNVDTTGGTLMGSQISEEEEDEDYEEEDIAERQSEEDERAA